MTGFADDFDMFRALGDIGEQAPELALQLPPLALADGRPVRGRVLATAVRSVSVRYRHRGEARWVNAPVLDENFTLPGLDSAGWLEVEAKALSWHGEPVCAHGSLEVRWPDASIRALAMETSVTRHAALSWLVQVRWVRAVRWSGAAQGEWVGPVAEDPVTLPLPLDTGELGEHELTLTWTDWGGDSRCETFAYQVQARPVELLVQDTERGDWVYQLRYASEVRLRLAGDGPLGPAVEPQGVIVNTFLMPRQAVLDYRDEAGARGTRTFLLRPRPGGWPPVRGFGERSGWFPPPESNNHSGG